MTTGPDDATERHGLAAQVPGPGYTDLFGVSRDTLDRLRSLRTDAEELRVSLAEWDAEYHRLLDSVRLPSPRELKDLHDQVMQAWLDSVVGKTREEQPDRAHRQRLLGDLSVLEGPPGLAEVLERVDELPEARAWARREPSAHRDQTLTQLARHERYLRAWVHELDPDGDHRPAVDEFTGLPEQLVQRRRHVEDDVLGRVPVGLTEARARAYLEATEDQQREAGFWQTALGAPADEGPWKFRLLEGEIRRVAVVDFLRYAHEYDSPTGEAMRELWDNAELRDLLEDYLNR